MSGISKGKNTQNHNCNTYKVGISRKLQQQNVSTSRYDQGVLSQNELNLAPAETLWFGEPNFGSAGGGRAKFWLIWDKTPWSYLLVQEFWHAGFSAGTILCFKTNVDTQSDCEWPLSSPIPTDVSLCKNQSQSVPLSPLDALSICFTYHLVESTR